ncbi:putative transcription factor homeobox-WOX family [Helianthus anomalus]
MEEPQEVHTDENRALQEKKPKRIVKTRAQIAALENFYNEHKYPNEAMKAELAESIGLTEKQVSGWFCHRRLKDKKLPNDEVGLHGKQDRSSGVIQDRGSGLRQDSCGSTKQGDNKHYDLKEVESKRFTTTERLPVEVPFDHGSQHNNIMNMEDDDHDGDDDDDDTSSGSSSPLKDNFHHQNVDRLGTLASKYPTLDDLKSVKGRAGPSGYLKVKGQVENAAITAVKRQLGRNYKEDGPPLGIEFDPLPPGAFENPVKLPVNQPYYVGDRTAHHPLEGSKTLQLLNGSKMHERYNPKSYDPMDLDESAGLEMRHASKLYERSQYKSAPPISRHSRHSLSDRSLQMAVLNDDSAGETSVHDRQFEPRIKHGPGVTRRPDSLSNHHHHHLTGYTKNFDGKKAESYIRNAPPKVNYRDRVEPLTSDFSFKRGEALQLEDGGGLSRKAPKDVEFNRERRGIDEYSKLVSPKIRPGNEMRVTKRSRGEFMHPRKEVLVDFPPIINKTKRSTAQMTSSFSDDETAETTSSGD